jgi:hypothetical protein
VCHCSAPRWCWFGAGGTAAAVAVLAAAGGADGHHPVAAGKAAGGGGRGGRCHRAGAWPWRHGGDPAAGAAGAAPRRGAGGARRRCSERFEPAGAPAPRQPREAGADAASRGGGASARRHDAGGAGRPPGCGACAGGTQWRHGGVEGSWHLGGRCARERWCSCGCCWQNRTGGPALATGGSGDVLAGLLAALLAQGLPCWHACCLAVAVHGLAGDRLARTRGRGLLASDLPLAIAEVLCARERSR